MINLKNRHINRTTMDELYSRLSLLLTPATSGSSAQAVLINDLPSSFPSWLSLLVFLYTEANGACQRPPACAPEQFFPRGARDQGLSKATRACAYLLTQWDDLGTPQANTGAFYPGFGAVSVHRREESQVLLV